MTIVTLAVAIFTLVMPPLDPRIPWLLVLVIAMGIFRRFEFLESWFILHGKIRAYAVARMITVLAFICVRLGLLFFDASLPMFLLVLASETAVVGLMSRIAYQLGRSTCRERGGQ